MSSRNQGTNSLVSFVLSRRFWMNLLFIILFFGVCLLATTLWLRIYTKHNHKSELPDYIGKNFDTALEEARSNKFRMAILDSVYIVGREGNIILNQEPVPGSMVKDNRTIYVTITKTSADQVAFSRIPVLYGRNYERKRRELYQSYQIESRIVGHEYDPGEPNHILEVRYNGVVIANDTMRNDEVMIDKGSTLEFIVSETVGGELEIPDLVCMTFAEARFLVTSSSLELGEVITDGTIGIDDAAFVTGQVPDPAEGYMRMGETIRLSLSRYKPVACDTIQ